jgi:TRAP-type mannitol/chloroaromatic compound transport system permease small subunit
MISLILDWALFFLVLFFLMPAVMIITVLTRDIMAQNRHYGLWPKDQARKSPG